MTHPTSQGVALVATQEFRVRLRTGRWRWLFVAWLAVLTAFTALLQAALHMSGTQGDLGVPLFGGLMLFVLGLVLVIAPALTAQSVNGDRERGTLATLQITRLTPAEIALGKLAAGWGVGLIALALTLPFVAWSMVEGGLTFTRVVAVLLVDALLMGVICAISQALSALLARTVTSALLSYLVVFALSLGTLIAFGLITPLTAEDVTTRDGQTITSVTRPDRIWWLLAPNPFVVLADSAPALPPRVRERDGQFIVTPDDPLSGLRQEIRNMRQTPLYGELVYNSGSNGLAVWPYGLGFDLLLGVGACWVTIRRLRAPSGKIGTGVRIG